MIQYTITSDEATEEIICNCFQFGIAKPTISLMNSQKQKGGTDCGLFAVAFIAFIAFRLDPTKLKFCQEKMRCHLVSCFKENSLSPFPIK